MSRRRRVTWIAVIAVLSLLSALVWWGFSKSNPEVIFAGFRERDGKRVAVFTFVNNTVREVVFESMFGITGAVRVRQFGGQWFERDPSSGFSGKRAARSGKRMDLSLQLTLPDGAKLDGPFRVRVDYHTDSIWSFPPFAWLPNAPKLPWLKSVWSEVVTP
jgi:hypothetical protein